MLRLIFRNAFPSPMCDYDPSDCTSGRFLKAFPPALLHRTLAILGLIFNTKPLAIAICDMHGPMAACHFAPPHSLEDLATSSNLAMCPSQT